MPSEELSWPTILTALVAVYGAGLATYTAVSSYLRNRRHIKVELSLGIMAPAIGNTSTVLLITASNPGDKPVTANSITLELPDRKHAILPHYPGSAQLPKELLPGQALTVYVDAHDFSKDTRDSGYSGTVRLRARCYEATGQLFKSKKLKYSIESWL